MLFGCPRHNINHSSENLKVIYIKRFCLYARINCQLKTSELKNLEKLVDQAVLAFEVLLASTGNVHFCTVKLYSW